MTRHRFEIASLVFGLLFAGVGLLFLSGDVSLWRVNWSWFWPAVLTLSGLMVLASLRPSRSDGDSGSDDGVA